MKNKSAVRSLAAALCVSALILMGAASTSQAGGFDFLRGLFRFGGVDRDGQVSSSGGTTGTVRAGDPAQPPEDLTGNQTGDVKPAPFRVPRRARK